MKYSLLLSFLFHASSYSNAQSFLRFYPGALSPVPGININSVPTCLEKTNDGGFLIGGYSAHPDTLEYEYMQLRKIDAEGNVVWEKLDRLSGVSLMRDIAVGADNSIYCAVYNNSDGTVVKRNASGDIIWATNLIPAPDSCGEIYRIIKTSDGNLAVCGVQTDCFSSSSGDGFVAKLDTSGQIIWKTIIPVPLGNDFRDVLESNDSTFLSVGTTEEIDTGAMLGLSKVLLSSINSHTGQLNWFKTYGRAHTSFSMVKVSNDSIVIGGGLYNIGSNADGFLLLADDTAEFVYEVIDTIPRGNFVRRLIFSHQSIFSLQSGSIYDTVNQWSSSILRLNKYNSTDLSLEFSKNFSGYGSHGAEDMEILDDGRVAIAFFETNATCNGCTGLLVIDSTYCVPEWCNTDIEEVYTQPTVVFPNPFIHFFTYSGIEKADVTVCDFLGRVIFSKKDVYPNQWIEVENISDGIYFLELANGNIKYQHKIIRTK
jgi:hypothetical protein